MQIDCVQTGSERQARSHQPTMQFHLVTTHEQPQIRHADRFDGGRAEQRTVEQRRDSRQQISPCTRGGPTACECPSRPRSAAHSRDDATPARGAAGTPAGPARRDCTPSARLRPDRVCRRTPAGSPARCRSCGRPSSSASQTQSAPSASACSIPSAKPPAPPRFRREPIYVVATGWPATRSRTRSSSSLSTTTMWSSGTALGGQGVQRLGQFVGTPMGDQHGVNGLSHAVPSALRASGSSRSRASLRGPHAHGARRPRPRRPARPPRCRRSS